MNIAPAESPTPDASILIESLPDEVHWGWLPTERSAVVATIDSGATVTFDTISHEGVLGDQGRDPVAFFGSYGIAEDAVMADAIALAGSGRSHDMGIDGPHVVTGPVAVRGARPGDVLKIEMLEMRLRAGYGIVSSRHGRGALPDQLPAGPVASTLCTVDGALGRIESDGGRSISFPLRPFLGLIGVAPAGDQPAHSVPPGAHGGNIDLTLLTEGSTLYLPVQVADALLYVGDPHYAQGDGEVALTAFEAPLRATLRVTVIPADAAREAFGILDAPMAEAPGLIVPMGLDVDLNVAVQKAVRASLSLLTHRYGLAEQTAYAYLSAAADVCVTQVVDRVKGAHVRIRLDDFADWTA
ncbi:MAG: acetamidase [Pseudonocardiales bacterium]|nr:acetamidase [Pseudonocardiales bacterium]